MAGSCSSMEDGRIPKNILYGELANGERDTGRPQLRHRDVCKRDMKALEINSDHWKDLAFADRSRWRSILTNVRRGDLKNATSGPCNIDRRGLYDRDCQSRIGLFSRGANVESNPWSLMTCGGLYI